VVVPPGPQGAGGPARRLKGDLLGHLAAKDVYRDLGNAIDGLTVRTPWSETLRAILRELYTVEEADLVSRMPTGLVPLERIAQTTGVARDRLPGLLEGLAAKGLVMDLEAGGEYRYTVSPFVVGVFEFTMMRTDGGVDFPRVAGLFREYLAAGGFFEANAGHGERVSVMRTIPHVQTVADAPHVEVLDHEKAEEMIERSEGAVVGTCSCRHEKLHLGEKRCDVPLATCLSFGTGDSYMARRALGRAVPKEEARELLAMAREQRLVLNADNVRKDVSFICLCCSCCCNVLGGIRRFGLPNILVTSRFIAEVDGARCTGCGACAKACPIEAIRMSEPSAGGRTRDRRPRVDASFCIGCGVCGLACTPRAMRLVPRAQRVILPENTVERVILQALERGTLQNFIVDNPNLASARFLRAVLGVFLALPPVKRVMMSDGFRSRFLARIAR
jgi:ferredoxin